VRGNFTSPRARVEATESLRNITPPVYTKAQALVSWTTNRVTIAFCLVAGETNENLGLSEVFVILG
jgi:hypothetical protein